MSGKVSYAGSDAIGERKGSGGCAVVIGATLVLVLSMALPVLAASPTRSPVVPTVGSDTSTTGSSPVGIAGGSVAGLTSASMVRGDPDLLHSVNVAYVYDQKCGLHDGKGVSTGSGDGVDDDYLPGCSIFVNAVDGSPIPSGGTYTTSGGVTVTFTNILASTVNSGGLSTISGYDTVMLYEICDIGSPSLSNLLPTLNEYLEQGLGKVIIYDADDCAAVGAGLQPTGGVPDYGSFLFPFTTSNPGPEGAQGSVTYVEPESAPAVLTAGLTTGYKGGTDAIGDSNTFTANTGGWCAAENGSNANGTVGIQIAYHSTVKGGLAIYVGNDNWYTDGPNAWDAQVFNNTIDQPFSPSSLPCAAPAPAGLVAGQPTGPIPGPVVNISRGQEVTLTAHPSGGTPPYAYQWLSTSGGTCDNLLPGESGPTIFVSPTSTLSYCYTVTDNAGNRASSASVSVDVFPPLVAGAVTPTSPTISSGGSVVLTAIPSGGVPPYSYQWYAGSSINLAADGLIAGATASSYVAAPEMTTYYCYSADDGAEGTPPEIANSSCDLVTVTPAPLVAGSPTPNPAVISLGQEITLTANPSGGTPPYAYKWYAGSFAVCVFNSPMVYTTSTVTVSPTSSIYVCYTVTDSTGTTVASPAVLVTVYPPLVAGAVTPSSPTISSGGSVALTAAPSGGVPPYSYQWYSGPSPNIALDFPIAGATSPTYVASPAVDTYFCYTLDDAAEGTPAEIANSTCDLVTVTPVPGFYYVNFTEAGLPVGTNWFVTVEGTTQGPSHAQAIATLERNGTYTYSFEQIPGYLESNPAAGTTCVPTPTGTTFTVNGRSCEIEANYTSVNYTITFNETGLAIGTTWDVTLDGTVTLSETVTSTTPGVDIIVFTGLKCGSYSFTVSAPFGFAAVPTSGTVTVCGPVGNETYQLITFYPLTCNYTITFDEEGLPLGVVWDVVLDGVLTMNATVTTPPSVSANITFSELCAGNYSFAVSSPRGYMASPSSGRVIVPFTLPNGSEVDQPITFYFSPPSGADLALVEKGLPSGTTWGVTLRGKDVPNGTETVLANTNSIGFSVPKGAYSYTISKPSEYSAEPLSGSVTVGATAKVVNVAFALLTKVVTFRETGLALGSSWSVTVTGPEATYALSRTTITYSSNDPTISVTVVGGNYTWNASTVVTPVGTFVAHPASGSFGFVVTGNHLTKVRSVDPTKIKYLLSATSGTVSAGSVVQARTRALLTPSLEQVAARERSAEAWGPLIGLGLVGLALIVGWRGNEPRGHWKS